MEEEEGKGEGRWVEVLCEVVGWEGKGGLCLAWLCCWLRVRSGCLGGGWCAKLTCADWSRS